MSASSIPAVTSEIPPQPPVSAGKGARTPVPAKALKPPAENLNKIPWRDLSVPLGTPVISAQAGTITVVGEGGANGKYVVVDHGFGVRTSYCHLSEWQVTKGQVVQRGDPIALSGNTGRSTGPHLHFNVKVAGELVDPLGLRREPPATM